MSQLNQSRVDSAEIAIMGMVVRNLIVAIANDGRSQGEIARAAGLHPAALSAIVTGHRRFSLRMLARLSVSLRLRPTDLLQEVL
jgi:plasmid maintenance system antidote protein VapI